MKIGIVVENIKCSGCASTIQKEIKQLTGVETVHVDIGRAAVEVDYSDSQIIEAIKQRLITLGYPEKGSVQGLTKVTTKAKSMVSCAVGKFS